MPWYATLGVIVLLVIFVASLVFGDPPKDQGY